MMNNNCCAAGIPSRRVPCGYSVRGGKGFSKKPPRNHQASPPRRNNGFTLIELLVVIAIISLLISILLPSLQQAKELARAVVCAENMRNTNTAMAMYMNDNNDIFPPCYETVPDGSGADVYESATWQQKLLDYAGNNPHLMLCSKYQVNNPERETRRNYYYVFMAGKEYPKIGYNHKFLSCGGEYVVGFGCITGGVYRRSADIRNTSNRVELVDCYYTFASFGRSAASLDSFYRLYASFPHNNSDSNYGFVDGHVESAPEDSPLHYDPVSWTGKEF